MIVLKFINAYALISLVNLPTPPLKSSFLAPFISAMLGKGTHLS